MRFIDDAPGHELSFPDVFLVPSRSDVASRYDVDLAPEDGTGCTIPLVSANMNSVTGPRLAAQLARRGGLGVLPQDGLLQTRAQAIARVKEQDPRVESPRVVGPGTLVAEAALRLPPLAGHGAVVVDADGAVLGVVEGDRLRGADPATPMAELAVPVPGIDADSGASPREVFRLMHEAGVGLCTVLRHGRLVGVVSRAGAVRDASYRPNVAADGRLRVAAAVGVNGSPADKAEALVEAGADVIVVDTAHGHQGTALRAVEAVAARELGVPLVAGNVVTSSGVRDLVSAGASIVKVGVGPGAMCTTRMMTAVGRPQFSAVMETAAAATALGAHVWADGGVRYPRDVALALAAGGAQVMIGSWFAGTIEAPGQVRRDEDGRVYKESWGMASAKAVADRFSATDPFELERKRLFAEGISSSHIYIDPDRPSIDDLLDMITSGVRSSFSYAGARNLAEFRDRAVVGVQSASGYEEGKALPVSW
ncbi:GuaB1 family IMP dehydrogenase-related protein [Mycetocola reblochoni]|uniref:GMP reductase n=1 Tax=Mycetocola reblochoni TaxID=331618 RepID=UPI003F9DCF1A